VFSKSFKRPQPGALRTDLFVRGEKMFHLTVGLKKKKKIANISEGGRDNLFQGDFTLEIPPCQRTPAVPHKKITRPGLKNLRGEKNFFLHFWTPYDLKWREKQKIFCPLTPLDLFFSSHVRTAVFSKCFPRCPADHRGPIFLCAGGECSTWECLLDAKIIWPISRAVTQKKVFEGTLPSKHPPVSGRRLFPPKKSLGLDSKFSAYFFFFFAFLELPMTANGGKTNKITPHGLK